MVISGLVPGRTWLGKNQWFTGGWPDNVGQTIFFCDAAYQPLRSQL